MHSFFLSVIDSLLPEPLLTLLQQNLIRQYLDKDYYIARSDQFPAFKDPPEFLRATHVGTSIEEPQLYPIPIQPTAPPLQPN